MSLYTLRLWCHRVKAFCGLPVEVIISILSCSDFHGKWWIEIRTWLGTRNSLLSLYHLSICTNHLFCSALEVSSSTPPLVDSTFGYFLDFIEFTTFMRDILELGCFTICYVVRDPYLGLSCVYALHVSIPYYCSSAEPPQYKHFSFPFAFYSTFPISYIWSWAGSAHCEYFFPSLVLHVHALAIWTYLLFWCIF